MRKFLTGLSEIREGGSYLRFLRMVRALANSGHDVRVFSTSTDRVKRPNVHWHQIGTHVPSFVKTGLFFLSFLPYVLYHVTFTKVRDIIAFGPVYASLLIPIRFFGKRYRIYCMVRGMLSDEYGYQERGGPLKMLVSFLERVGFSASDRIIVVSNTFGERIVKRYKVEKGKITHLPNEVPELGPEEVDSTFGKRVWGKDTPEKDLRLFTGGVITQGKNFEMLLKATQLFKIPFHICVAGKPAFASDKDYFKRLKTLVKDLGIEENVTWLGWLTRENLLGVLQTSNLFVSTSKHEGMSNILLEALSLDVACFSNYTQEAIELLKFRELTFKTVEELSIKIEKFYYEREFAERIIQMCREVKKIWSFDWEAKLIQTLER